MKREWNHFKNDYVDNPIFMFLSWLFKFPLPITNEDFTVIENNTSGVLGKSRRQSPFDFKSVKWIFILWKLLTRFKIVIIEWRESFSNSSGNAHIIVLYGIWETIRTFMQSKDPSHIEINQTKKKSQSGSFFFFFFC